MTQILKLNIFYSEFFKISQHRLLKDMAKETLMTESHLIEPEWLIPY